MKHFILFSLLIIGLSACQKIDSNSQVVTQASVDDSKIQAYIKANKISAIKDESGVYYQIITPGTDPKPISTSTVKITYTYGYLNGVTLGRIDGAQIKLNAGVIAGLRIGVTKIGNGGRILIIVPSGLAYGATVSGEIPANSVITYTIDLNGITAS